MANTIQIKRKTTTGAPSIEDLADGEFCYVEPDNVLYIRKNATKIITYYPATPISQVGYDALDETTKDENMIYLITD